MGDDTRNDDTRNNDTSGDENADDGGQRPSNGPKGGHPGPVDGGGNGGMATRENAPDVAGSDRRTT